MSWKEVFSRQSLKDAKKLSASALKLKTQELLASLERDPFKNSPSFENLAADLQGSYPGRINLRLKG